MKGGRGHTHITQKAYNGPKLRGEMAKLDEVTGVRAKAFKTTVEKRRTSMSGVFGCRTKSQASYSTRLIPDLPKP